jgi:hypothetical protein
MAAQHLRARASRPELQRYTLEFRNGRFQALYGGQNPLL